MTTTTSPNNSPRRRTKRVDRKMVSFPGERWMENRGDATLLVEEQVAHLPAASWERACRVLSGEICEDALGRGVLVEPTGVTRYLLRTAQSLACGEAVCLDCGTELEPMFDESDDTNQLPESWCDRCQEEKDMAHQVWAETEDE